MRYLLHCVALAVLSPAMGLSAQTTVPTTPPEVLRIARETEKAGILKQLAGYPTLPPAKLSDVALLGLHDGHLTLKTRLPPTTMPSRLEISDLPGICTLTLRQVDNTPPGNGAYEPDLFLLERYRFDEPNSTVCCMTVEALPTSVQLAWSTETLTGISEVTLVEQVGPTGPAGDRTPANVQMRASSQPREDDAGQTQIELKAPDFQTLRREHPAEVEKYIGPIVHELHAEAVVLPSDSVLAWQVFSAEAQLAPELIDAIHQNVKALDADAYADRQAAVKSLEKIGPAVAVELARLDRSKLSAEQTSVINGVIREFRPVSPETAKRLSEDPAFLLSSLTDADVFIARGAFAHLQKLTRLEMTFDFTTHDEARRDAVRKIRERVEQANRP